MKSHLTLVNRKDVTTMPTAFLTPKKRIRNSILYVISNVLLNIEHVEVKLNLVLEVILVWK